jgi:hypothetical protein
VFVEYTGFQSDPSRLFFSRPPEITKVSAEIPLNFYSFFVPALEHAIFVWRILRHGLPDVPEFCDVISLESENMNQGYTRIARLQLDP